MKKILLLTFITISSVAYSQDKHPIDTWYENCIDSNSSTMGMIMCADSSAVLWDIELNKNYNLLMSLLEGDAKDAMKEAQREWIKFRDKEQDAIRTYYAFIYEKMGGGTMYPMLASGALMEVVRKRVLEVKGMYEELNTHLGNGEDR